METTLTPKSAPQSENEQSPSLRVILKMLGMKEVATNVFSLPTKKKE